MSNLPNETRHVIDGINARFKSGNTIPVERATITRAEWELLRSHLIADLPAKLITARALLDEAAHVLIDHAGLEISESWRKDWERKYNALSEGAE